MQIDDIGTQLQSLVTQTYRIDEHDPLSASANYRFIHTIECGDWRVRVESRTRLSCDRKNFFLTRTLEAYEGDQRVFIKDWDETIPRDGF